jgi:hypothetical protein
MSIQLIDSAIIDSFIKELPTLNFIPSSDHDKIRHWLTLLTNEGISRYEKAILSRDIWNFFVEQSLRSFTTNLRGLRQLSIYFDQFIEYENFLFSIDRNYRDHTIHSVWVMLLGFFMIRNFDILNLLPATNIHQMNSSAKPKVDRIEKMIADRQSLLWCLISLCHDLGYPIEKTKKANQFMSNMISNFGFLTINQLQYDFTIVHQTAIQHLLKTLSSILVVSGVDRYKIGTLPGISLDFAKSFENLDHGIMSAFLLQKYLDRLCETSFYEGIDSIHYADEKEAADFITIVILLSAISSHTSKFRYSLDFNNFDSLLIIADEAEEFSRYARSKTTNEWINLNCRTELNISKHELDLRFSFDNKNISETFQIEDFFKAKIEKLHYKFQLLHDSIEQLSIQCRDLTKSPPHDYIYTQDTKSLELITPSRTIKDCYTEFLNYISKN